MVDKKDQTKWRIIGESAKGATHVRNNLPNQDAIIWSPESVTKLPLILALSDGHGSAKSFRSEHGSLFAVNTAIKVLHSFINNQQEAENLSAIKDFAQLPLLQKLVMEWRGFVTKDLEAKPFTNAEWERLIVKAGTAARRSVEENNFLAYGATLLAVLVTESFVLYLQLGDGDIICVDSEGETTRPFAEDENRIGDDTYSLCMDQAWQHIKVKFVRHLESPPPMILVSTDGYSKSFGSEEDFCKIGKDYLEMIRKEGCDKVAESLLAILEETSHTGSGDDITLGIIKMLDDRDIIDISKDNSQRISALESRFEETAGRDEILQFAAIHANLREELQTRIENAVRAYAHAVQEFQKRLEDVIQLQSYTMEELQKRFVNTSKEESQIWKAFREEQQTQIVGIKDTLADSIAEQKNLIQRIAKLQLALIVTICLVIISIGSNISFWFWTVRTQTIAPTSREIR